MNLTGAAGAGPGNKPDWAGVKTVLAVLMYIAGGVVLLWAILSEYDDIRKQLVREPVYLVAVSPSGNTSLRLQTFYAGDGPRPDVACELARREEARRLYDQGRPWDLRCEQRSMLDIAIAKLRESGRRSR